MKKIIASLVLTILVSTLPAKAAPHINNTTEPVPETVQAVTEVVPQSANVAPTPEPPKPVVAEQQPIIGCEHYRHLISQYDWNVEVAMAVMKAESTCDPTALNNTPKTRDYSVGLFQINLYGANARNRPSEAQLKDPATNIAWAYKLYSDNGKSFIGQWGVCRSKVRCY